MTEKEKYSDKRIRKLIQDTELIEAPPGMNEKIMDEVRKLKPVEKKSPDLLRPAWIFLILAIIILPFFIKLIPEIITGFIGSDNSSINSNVSNFSFVVMVIFAGALLLIAEQLISVGFMGRE